eukprot:GFYU01042642.1.p1 GENE.GFYU01042642.1~~GFYU01042642.1.p1  ORF type:complete len:190 (-),score=21.30 GFYU01042642.1:445-1014(-)
MSSGSMSSTSSASTASTTTTTTTPTTAAPLPNEVAFTVNSTVMVDAIRVAIADAINVLASTIVFVSDSNPPALTSGFGDAVRTVVFSFENSSIATAAIAKAKDGSLSSVGVTGAIAVVPSSPTTNTDDDESSKTTVIVIVVVAVIVLILAICVSFVAYRKCKSKKYREGDGHEVQSGAFRLGVPDRELL